MSAIDRRLRHRPDDAALINERVGLASALRILLARRDALDAVFQARGGWSRAFLVNNPSGHVHSSMDCATCNRNGRATNFKWLVEYSGRTEEQIIEAAGSRACTVCYPDAPIDRPSVFRSDEELARDLRRADREHRREAAQAKAIHMPDGSPLRDRWGVIRTERAAEIAAVDALVDLMWYGTASGGDGWAFIDAAVDALAAKRDEPVRDVADLITAKAIKKYRRVFGDSRRTDSR
ncbi:hypothetical protein [Nocardia puris]|nr:hypothetical protein [Nocardia puris]